MHEDSKSFMKSCLFCCRNAEREAAVLKNTKFTEDHHKKWLCVISNDFMSSEGT